ncbi:beta/gamma crystallin domain-containing protein [Streptomyces sp. NPDC056224]|uniref:beta/gamma crystallin domain-containing protein n=1 Tax=Streptomyces sp. NPDC056224 TaxID=3345750 RepID=UPI0035D6097D
MLPASSASAINRVGCTEMGYLTVHNAGGSLCFANAGSQSVAIYGVDQIWTGNNKLTMEYVPRLGAPATSGTIEKWSYWTATGAPIHEITKIRIW